MIKDFLCLKKKPIFRMSSKEIHLNLFLCIIFKLKQILNGLDYEIEEKKVAKIRDAALARALTTPHKPHKPMKKSATKKPSR